MIDTTANKSELKGLIRQNEDIAAFIGAGCSKVLNIPVWDDLLAELNNEFMCYATKEEMLEAIKKEDYPKVASNIQAKAADKKKYQEILKRFTRPRSCYFTSLHVELIQLAKTIITTNYDKSFEETFESLKRINKSSDLDYHSFTVGGLYMKGIGVNRHVYHIHGDNDKENFILTYEAYKELYNREVTEVASIIHTVFNEFSVVFVGFSFNDNFFVSFLEDTLLKIAEERKRRNVLSPPVHFCIMPNTLFKDYLNAREMSDRNINITDLVNKGLLFEKREPGLSEPIFYFDTNAEYRIQSDLQIDSLDKKFLLNTIDLFRSNKAKVELFDKLSIKPITFDGNNYLEIEAILRELNEPFIPSVDSYTHQ